MAEYAQEPAPPEVAEALDAVDSLRQALPKTTEGGSPPSPVEVSNITSPVVESPATEIPAIEIPSPPAIPALPSYALEYAPLFHLHDKEAYWPGNPLEHILNTLPHTRSGEKIVVSEDILGKCAMLDLPHVNTTDTFLCLNDDPRVSARIASLLADHGKPDTSGKSESSCWMIQVDKENVVRPGIVDIFYFLFYPYNYGNSVCFTPFGNHVGDWEHVMIRFDYGQPIAIHLSAHANGHSYAWETIEKREERPVVYIATGSHAMYGKTGTHYYSGVPLVGPTDHTSRGPLWDPVHNYVASSYSLSSFNFSNLTSPDGTSAAELSPTDVLNVLNFKGRWGNSFSDIRNTPEAWYNKGKKKLSMLKWAEAPTGPKEKSLDRVGMSWNTDQLEHRL